MKQVCLFLLAFVIALAGCGGGPSASPRTAPVSTPETERSLNTIVFIGDSLTAFWDLSTSFPGKDYINRGVSKESTQQMLSRFQKDVVDAHPDAVVIWAGTNDLTDKVPAAILEHNLELMYERSRAAGIVPIAVTITPRRGDLAAANPEVIEVDRWIRAYAAAHNMAVAEFYAATVDESGMLRGDMAIDYVHFSQSAYSILNSIASAAIAEAGQM